MDGGFKRPPIFNLIKAIYLIKYFAYAKRSLQN